MTILDERRSCNVLQAQKPSITSDPEYILIVERERIVRAPFHGWAGVLAATDALECILRREGSVLVAAYAAGNDASPKFSRGADLGVVPDAKIRALHEEAVSPWIIAQRLNVPVSEVSRVIEKVI